MKTPKVYTPFDPPPGPTVDCSNDPPLTKQSFANECDINQILAQYEATGYIDPLLLQTREAAFGDFSDGEDFTYYQDMLVKARQAFDALPAKLRSRFANSPAQLLDFLNDPANREEAITLGIIKPPDQPPAPVPIEAGPPPSGPVPAKTDPKPGQSA